jgi:hypothetical protein
VRWLEGESRLAGSGGLKSALEHGDDSARLALPLLIAALVLAVVELALGRWFSHAVKGEQAGGGAIAGAAAAERGAAV